MGRTAVEWAHFTHNGWIGCSHKSPGCEDCYAEAGDNRWGHHAWGAHGLRRITSDDNWNLPRRWNRQAARFVEETGEHPRVFALSYGDVFEDHPALVEPRKRLFDLIEQTPDLIWMLLSKRPENAVGMTDWGPRWPAHVWMGTSVEDRIRACERVPLLLSIPARLHFLSVEPLYEDVADELGPQLPAFPAAACTRSPITDGDRFAIGQFGGWLRREKGVAGVDWVIVGGKSGLGRVRPLHPAWPRRLRDACGCAGVPFFFKQWGEFGVVDAPHRRADIVVRADGRHWPVATGDIVRDGTEVVMRRLGKKTTGRLLDGREYHQLPAEAYPNLAGAA